LVVRAAARTTTTTRKRMVGGFYSYDNQTDTQDLGQVCGGKSDSRGLLTCTVKLDTPGRVELVATARDAQGRQSLAANSVYVNKLGEVWFGGENHDRIDVLPEKKNYAPGETARFQVRMPYRAATALVAVEREGIMETHVVKLDGKDPAISLQVKPEWGPNVYVSVLALRGRLRDVPWYSFFTWGWRAPMDWWRAWRVEGKDYVPPTAMVDLSKPSFRLGVGEIRVGAQNHTLTVKVAADKPSYQIRGKAQVTLTGTLPGGKPAAGAEVAVAAVDQALLELMPNDSWNLLDAMLQRRSWGVATSTAQMEIIGRRHYGRKAVPAGGGGGKSQTRELLDTLLLWNPRVVLDANGRATVTVPLNDALTTFRIVAVADQGTGLFGTGQTTISTAQDLQIISGLPPLVREGDQFRAQITLRNTTKAAMKVQATPSATPLTLTPQTVEIPAGEAREIAWDVNVPAPGGTTRIDTLQWQIEAHDTLGSKAADALKLSQRVVPAVPLTVQQGELVQLGGPYTLPVAPPADALPGQGGVKLALQPRLAEGLPAIRDWFIKYPFVCLEQKASKAIGLRDAKLWQDVLAQMPTYLDEDGLASYFPPRDGDAHRGSDILTAYILAATEEASHIDKAYALPGDLLEPMARGLTAFVEGRIERKFWSPRADLDIRKLAAIEALSRYGKANAHMLGSITLAPNQWPTSAVIDWLQILQRLKDAPQREARIAEAGNILKARLSYQGTKLIFSTDKDDYLWWLMTNGDVNAARLMLAVMDDPAWKDDLGKLVGGLINRQQNGAWHTTTGNFWGGLALEQFSRKFESAPVGGVTTAELGQNKSTVDWSRVQRIEATDAEGIGHQGTFSGAPSSPGNLRNNTMFMPWPVGSASAPLHVTHEGSGKPWLTLQSVAAVQLKAPFAAGYSVKKTITPVEQAVPGKTTRGDVLRITLEVNASADMTWAVITDPIPAGATILGSGLGRDSEIATQGERSEGYGWFGFEERTFEVFRRYYEYLPKGVVKMQYTVRLNN
ncbi:MAG: alpha-2-macroglobulin, partial [Burkholderiaceae bacterium]|nr:alpha-2-macroglobulin [Burkholderiaceae bacterium]